MSFRQLKLNAAYALGNNRGLAIVIILIQTVLFSLLSPTALGLILIMPLNIGLAYAFIKMSRNEPAEFNDLLRSLQSDYLSHLVQLTLKILYLFLWSLLLFIPGIIKNYSYFMVEYILADNPQEKDAITKSREMMNGHKFELFLLQLSFIGWFILSALTFGILYLIYVGPYYQQTMANYYIALKSKDE